MIFVIGVIIFVAGIVLAIAVPATVTWKPESEILASEKPLMVSAGWNSESDSLIDEVITVDLYETYDYWFGYKPLILEEAKNFVINGTAIEQSSPQLWFNFYVFDSTNFDLWEAGASYTAYYETMGKTSVSFSFSIATEDEVFHTFYFVVEEYVMGVKPVVHVTSTISWAEKASLYDCSDYFTSWELILTFEQAKNFVLNGSATEVSNNKFNFYIFDTDNYFDWIGGESYTSYYEVKNVTTTSFSIPLTEDEARSIFYFVAENPLLDTSETVKVSATLEWNEKATIAATIGGIVLGGIIAFLGFIVIIAAGVAALVFKPKPPAPKPTLPTRMCTQCGWVLPPDVKFCPHCGKTVEHAKTEET